MSLDLTHVNALVTTAGSTLTASLSTVSMVLTMLFTASKAVSTSKSVPVVAHIQKLFDLASAGLIGFGNLSINAGGIVQQISGVLANILKSDGYLGVK